MALLRSASLALSWVLVGSCIATAPTGGAARGKSAKVKQPRGAIGAASYTGGDRAISRHNLIANATFNDGTSLPWMTAFTIPAAGEATVKDGALCLEVTHKGANPWDAQFRHREMVVEGGHTYSISFKIWATQATKVRAKLGMQGPPFVEYWVDTFKVDTTPRTFTGTFTKDRDDDPAAEFTFHVGGNLAYGVNLPFSVCVDDVRLEDPQFVRKEAGGKGERPAVLVNQTGYLPGLVKLAVVRSDSREPLAWKLLDQGGQAVAAGTTQPAGPDAPSGDSVHVLDFSSVTRVGRGYVLEVALGNGGRSHPFDIAPDVYKRMKYDALSYFFQNRSGIEIAPQFVPDKSLARPAGHLSDKSVPCADGAGCTYKLDVSGGWYDAGDHGKYVVNGGISLWTLLNLHERLVHAGSSAKDFADGKLAIPEKGNGVSDLLDEARWQLEFMLKMQVPEWAGDKAGLVHHKIHDKEWTALALAPHEDPMPRFLYPPSTAATLNVAATAAQGARIWKQIDPAFSQKCLVAAERAFAAARRHPALFAPAGAMGGGPYDDKHVEDELYWAAAELFATTKKDEYRQQASRSPYYLKVPKRLGEGAESGLPSAMTWQNTEALGTISLALVPGALPAAEAKAAQRAIVEAADLYLDILKQRGYRVPVDYGSGNRAPWGSNSFILNNLVVLGLAHDFTGERKYLNGVVAGMDYLLGKNPLDQSYVTGYGERPLENPHHRFWAYQSNTKYPKAPPGAISGGPNSGLNDPYVKAAGMTTCAPEKCFVDHIESWSTNEITINWNAPFAWALAFLDEKADAAPPKGATPAPIPGKASPRKAPIVSGRAPAKR